MKFNKSVSSYNVLIVGLARNCAKVLDEEINKISKSFGGFCSLKWLIIESDSDDNTVQLLKALKDKREIDFMSLGSLRGILKKRTERIARCRNEYVRLINNSEKYLDVDYIAVVDLDGVNALLTRESVEKCWSISIEWDACFANQKGAYYDIWALRHELWSPNDCWKQYRYFVDCGIDHESALYKSVLSRMITISEKSLPISVNSAFGGLGIYKRELFRDCLYVGLDDEGQEVCEHISAHQQMKNKGANLYVIPSLINGGWNEHSQHAKLHKIIYLFFRFYVLRYVIGNFKKLILKN